MYAFFYSMVLIAMFFFYGAMSFLFFGLGANPNSYNCEGNAVGFLLLSVIPTLLLGICMGILRAVERMTSTVLVLLPFVSFALFPFITVVFYEPTLMKSFPVLSWIGFVFSVVAMIATAFLGYRNISEELGQESKSKISDEVKARGRTIKSLESMINRPREDDTK